MTDITWNSTPGSSVSVAGRGQVARIPRRPVGPPRRTAADIYQEQQRAANLVGTVELPEEEPVDATVSTDEMELLRAIRAGEVSLRAVEVDATKEEDIVEPADPIAAAADSVAKAE